MENKDLNFINIDNLIESLDVVLDVSRWDTSKITNFHNITTDIKDDQYD